MKLTLILSALLCFFNSFISSQTKDSIKTKEIEKVIIKGKKKQIEQTEKGIVLNVSGTNLEQKDNASEVLKFAPNVSQISGLKILGSSRIQIILNGKEVKINPEQSKNAGRRLWNVYRGLLMAGTGRGMATGTVKERR